MTTDRSVLVFANAAAGSADREPVEQALAGLRAETDVEVVVPGEDADLEALVRRAPGRDLVVLGGDGSVHAVLEAIHRAGLLPEIGAVGIIPLGTGNDFARSRGLPLRDPTEAARIAVHGDLLEVDLLTDERGGVVVNAVHAGIAAEATAHAEEVKGRLGVAGYAVGAIRAGLANNGWHLRVVVDDEVVTDGSHRVLMVTLAVGNSIGGGTRVAPRANPSDGMIQVIVSRATSPRARASFALDLRRGEHIGRDDVTVRRGRTVHVEAAGHPFGVNTDGDLDGEHRSRTWTIRPDAWVCRVPAGAGGT